MILMKVLFVMACDYIKVGQCNLVKKEVVLIVINIVLFILTLYYYL